MLPALLPGLSRLRVLRLPVDDTYEDWPPLDFSHMKQLQELINADSYQNCSCFFEVHFPVQLQRLHFGDMYYPHQLDAVGQLQQLQGLTFLCRLGDSSRGPPPDMVQLLQPLMQLSALQQLSLHFDRPKLAAAAAAVWPHLPQLRELAVRHLHELRFTEKLWNVFISGLAAATSLTKLELEAAVKQSVRCPGYSVPSAPVAACGTVADLTNLRDLHIRCELCLLSCDALALTALTNLTRLVLDDLGAAVGDEAAAAIARSCRQLRHLNLGRCSLRSAACLAEIAHLRQLTELRVAENCGITTQSLVQLTGLTQLQRLELCLGYPMTGKEVGEFWASLAVSNNASCA